MVDHLDHLIAMQQIPRSCVDSGIAVQDLSPNAPTRKSRPWSLPTILLLQIYYSKLTTGPLEIQSAANQQRRRLKMQRKSDWNGWSAIYLTLPLNAPSMKAKYGGLNENELCLKYKKQSHSMNACCGADPGDAADSSSLIHQRRYLNGGCGNNDFRRIHGCA